jgi:hypothetical protein
MPSSSGICQSRNATSGFSFSMMATASLPDAASPNGHVFKRSKQRDEERAGRPLIVGDDDAESRGHTAT